MIRLARRNPAVIRSAPRTAQRFTVARRRERETAMAAIAMAVAGAFDVPVKALYNKRKHPEIVFPRHVAMFLLVEAGYTSCEVGRHFKRDHSTVLYARNAVDQRIQSDELLHGAVSLIAKRVSLI